MKSQMDPYKHCRTAMSLCFFGGRFRLFVLPFVVPLGLFFYR